MLQVLAAMPQGGVAFYNCGEHSGRSQPHKHLQVSWGAHPIPNTPLRLGVVAATQGFSPRHSVPALLWHTHHTPHALAACVQHLCRQCPCR